MLTNGKDPFLRVAEICAGIKVIYMSGYTEDVIAHQVVLGRGVQFIQNILGVQIQTKMLVFLLKMRNNEFYFRYFFNILI